MKTIAIDFDGVLHKYSKGYHDGTCYDEPMEGGIEAIIKLRNKGYEVVIFTCRNPDAIYEWFKKYWDSSAHGEVPDVTNKKPLAIAYVDDRGIRFTNWKDILNYF